MLSTKIKAFLVYRPIVHFVTDVLARTAGKGCNQLFITFIFELLTFHVSSTRNLVQHRTK